MSQRKIILVTGATGAQGGSVAKELLKEGNFAVRVLTRDSRSPKAIALAEAGAEIVEGNFDEIESLKAAMKDCYGVFGVTNFWEHFHDEYQQGKNLIDAVHQSQISHFVYSSLPDYSKLSKGALAFTHCDIKGQIDPI